MARILLVDDEEEFLKTIGEYLLSEGHDCVLADNGLLAISEIRSQKFDLIISDLKMPTMDGLQLVQALREISVDTPMIWLSGHATNNDFLEGWRSGLCEFLEKPVKFGRLKETIEMALALGPSFASESRILSEKKGG